MRLDGRGDRHALSHVRVGSSRGSPGSPVPAGTMASLRAAEETGMTAGITVGLVNKPGTLVRACDAVGGRATEIAAVAMPGLESGPAALPRPESAAADAGGLGPEPEGRDQTGRAHLEPGSQGRRRPQG